MGIFYLTHSGICYYYYYTAVVIIYIYTFIIMTSYMFRHLEIIEVCFVLFTSLAILFQTYVNHINMLTDVKTYL